ncbi:MAG: FAD-dependent oxidoreductase [Kiritimatiellae bacterium]|nr:FAD-dependent oxidoreductase [Kiritimatiellia bacterium]
MATESCCPGSGALSGIRRVHTFFPTLGTLCPNLLVAGRCVSADRLAASGLRVQGACMAMGQVTGQSAAMAAKIKCDVRKID